jgi:hypothetical protein
MAFFMLRLSLRVQQASKWSRNSYAFRSTLHACRKYAPGAKQVTYDVLRRTLREGCEGRGYKVQAVQKVKLQRSVASEYCALAVLLCVLFLFCFRTARKSALINFVVNLAFRRLQLKVAKIRRLASPCLSVCPSAAELILMTFDIKIY